jgi:hypothetical protein
VIDELVCLTVYKKGATELVRCMWTRRLHRARSQPIEQGACSQLLPHTTDGIRPSSPADRKNALHPWRKSVSSSCPSPPPSA